MQPFKTLTSTAIPVPLKDVDTDMIIPAQYLTSISREGYGENLFRRLRDEDPNFPLDKPRYQDAQILVARSNFGCGSSREHAAWALFDWGIRVVIAPDFADIFKSNSLKNGIVLVELPEDQVEKILTAATNAESASEPYQLTVNLESQTVTLPAASAPTLASAPTPSTAPATEPESLHFPFDSFRKHCILNGLDDLDYIRSHQEALDSYQSQRAAHIYYSTTSPNN